MFTCSCQQTSCLSLSIGNKKLSRLYKNLILNQVATEIAGLSKASWSSLKQGRLPWTGLQPFPLVLVNQKMRHPSRV